MKNLPGLIFLVMILLAAAIPCGAVDVDPILLDKPSPVVFECGENLFLEIANKAVIEFSLGGRRADDYFLFVSAEFLFLEENPWRGMDKSSFVLKHADANGEAELFPLNYMMTTMMSMKSGWKTLSDTLSFATLVPMYLVFDVPVNAKQGWSILFRPAERGGTASCEVEIPLKIQ